MKNKSLNVAFYNVHFQRIHKDVTVIEIVIEDKQMKVEYVLGSSICTLFFKEEVKLITFLDNKKGFG